MKNLGHAITGLLMSTFTYVSVLFTAVAVGYFLGYRGQSQSLLAIGMDYLVFNVFAGLLGGYIGGSTNGYSGALNGGIIIGILAAVVRLTLVYFV